MIKAIEFPNRTFQTKAELFAELKRNEDKIIGLKKAQLHSGASKRQFSFVDGEKAFKSTEKSSFATKENHIYPIISTTKYFDSHGDVHFDGCFGKTVKEQQGKVVYALDHELKYDSVLAWQKDVRMFVANIPWSMVGKSYEGETEALVFEIAKERITRKDVLASIENKDAEFENSIRMFYYKITLGINSDEKDFAENKAYYDSRISQIANKDAVEENGYFWGVEELGIHKEGSLVVAGGSNDATSIYEAVEDTSQKHEPSDDTQQQEKKFTFLKTK